MLQSFYIKLHGGYEVKFLKRHNQTMKFIETDEESYVKSSDIIRKLSKPITSSSARYQNMKSFSTDMSDLTNIF